MTVKEAQKALRKWAGEQAQNGNDDQCFAYDMAALLLDGVEDRSAEMIEWTQKEYERGFNEWQNKWSWNQESIKFWEGYWWVLRKFLDEFVNNQADELWLRGWDYDA